MRGPPLLAVALLWFVPQVASAETVLASNRASSDLCAEVDAELRGVGLQTRRVDDAGARRARRRAFGSETVDALVVCNARPSRIDVFYPTGAPLGELAFSSSAKDDPSTTAVYVSERIRSERFVADVPISVEFTPTLWWLGLGADVLLSSGGIAPLALITVDVGYRFARHWSLAGMVSVQPYFRRLNQEELQARLRFDQFGLALSYHPVLTPRFDLAAGARVSAVRLGTEGVSDTEGEPQGQGSSAWFAFPAGRLSLRIGLTRRAWLRVRGDVGALLPRAVVSGPEEDFGSLGRFVAQVGLGAEVHFR